MICACGNIMTQQTYFWECRIRPKGTKPSGCGRVEFFKENPNGKS